MCIICIKPKGVGLPKQSTRAYMWAHNPDGAGIMYPYRGAVVIEKGFMTLTAMEHRLNDLANIIDVRNTTIIMHYRITTHGGTCPQNTHPFPCTSNVRNLRATRTRTKLGIAHNGIIRIDTRPGISDTMEYIADVLAELPKGFARDKKMLKSIEDGINGSRMVFLDPTGRYAKVGTWQKGEDGCLYSNGNYKPFEFKFKTSNGKSFKTHRYSYPYTWDDYDIWDTTFEDTPYSYHTGKEVETETDNDDDAFLAYLYRHGELLPWEEDDSQF